jgi:hypothetical protein
MSVQPRTQELVLMVYKSLLDDVFLYEDGSDARKKDLSTAIMSIISDENTVLKYYNSSGKDVFLVLWLQITLQTLHSYKTYRFRLLIMLIFFCIPFEQNNKVRVGCSGGITRFLNFTVA